MRLLFGCIFKAYKAPEYLLFHDRALCLRPSEKIIFFYFCPQIYRKLLLRMGRAFHGSSCLVINPLNCNRQVSSVRLHDLNGFSYAELISLSNVDQTLFVNLFSLSQISIFLYIGVVIIDLCILIRFSIEKSGSKLTVRTV